MLSNLPVVVFNSGKSTSSLSTTFPLQFRFVVKFLKCQQNININSCNSMIKTKKRLFMFFSLKICSFENKFFSFTVLLFPFMQGIEMSTS